MRRRLVMRAAAAMFVLALSASPVLAESHADHWIVMANNTTDISGFGPVICGDHTYFVDSGTVVNVWLMKGSLDADGVAVDAGRAVETWTLDNVRVRSKDTGKVYHAVGSQRIKASWPAGADILGSGVGPYTNYSDILGIQIPGTRDGHFVALRQLPNGTFDVKDFGTCSGLTLRQ